MAGGDYDLIVIGAGPGGYALALECARRGLKTSLLEERANLGGTCLNVGCIPSKALLESSELFHRLNHEASFHGIRVPKDGITADLDSMMSRKTVIVEKLTGGIATLMKARKVDVHQGRAEVTAPGTVLLRKPDGTTGTAFTAPRVVLATGSFPAALPHMPFDGKRVIDSTDALSMTKVPASLAVIGGGAVGLEIGSIWNRLGSKVTIIEAMDQIVPGADSQASRTLTAALKKQGMTILTGSMVESAEISSRRVSLKVRRRMENDITAVDADKVLVAVGRKANIDSGLGQGIHPERTPDGRFLKVNEKFETSIPGLYAIGDLIGNPMLAHKAEDEALALASIFAGEGNPPWGGPIPAIVYTEPELAWAGQTEDELKAKEIPYEKGQFPYAANARALASGTDEGWVKLLSSPGDRRLLGAMIVGRGASELICEPVLVMAMGGCASDIALTVHGHPTMSEITREAALSLIGRPLHRS